MPTLDVRVLFSDRHIHKLYFRDDDICSDNFSPRTLSQDINMASELVQCPSGNNLI